MFSLNMYVYHLTDICTNIILPIINVYAYVAIRLSTWVRVDEGSRENIMFEGVPFIKKLRNPGLDS